LKLPYEQMLAALLTMKRINQVTGSEMQCSSGQLEVIGVYARGISRYARLPVASRHVL